MSVDEASVFEFMSLRPIRELPTTPAGQAIIRDDYIVPMTGQHSSMPAKLPGRYDVDIFSAQSPSPLCKDMFRLVHSGASLNALCETVERDLKRGYRNEIGEPSRPLNPVLVTARVGSTSAQITPLLASRPYYIRDGAYYILPGTVDDVAAPLFGQLSGLRTELTRMIDSLRIQRKTADWPLPGLSTHAEPPAWPGLIDLVFSVEAGTYASDYAIAKRQCFDAYYGLYVLRKQQPLRIEPVVEALQVLYALEKLASYLLFRFASQVPSGSGEQQRIGRLVNTLRTIYGAPDPSGMSIADLELSLDALALPFRAADATTNGPLEAQPVLHPMFLRLSLDWRPFNDLRPVGIGDLMVVKQKFLGYRKGEIAHIETVLSGESKSTRHQRTDRLETSVSYSSSEDVENTNDRQSTTRFELRREAEAVIKFDVGASLTAQVTYNGTPVVSSVTASANLAYSRSDTSKLASNFARDITERAVTRVQRSVSQQRTQTQLVETIEVNRHALENPAENDDHISGVYQWVDKIYQAEVRNYGRRLMFEIVIPEPAAFFVQQRLLAYAASMDLPDYTKAKANETDDSTAAKPVTDAGSITREVYLALNQSYMLDHLPPPAERVDGIAVVTSNGQRIFTKSSSYNDTGLKFDEYWNCSFAGIPNGYTLDSISVSGSVRFRGKKESDQRWINTLQIVFSTGGRDQIVFEHIDEDNAWWTLDGNNYQFPAAVPSIFASLKIGTKTCDTYSISISGSAKLTAAAFADWQEAVYQALTPARKRKTDDAGVPVEDPDVAAYRKLISEIKQPEIVELLQGQSSAWNEQVIKRELRRQGISQVSGEFDNSQERQILTSLDTMGRLGVGEGFEFPHLTIKEGTETARSTTANFDSVKHRIEDGYRVPDVGLSRRKGQHIQFIEHAFEWEQLSYVFYPYYWSTPPRWVELLSREDEADPNFTAFLQSGAARILLAVRPGFEQAVLHYLATREPWEGGGAPMIGDPLYLPIYMEIREKQDDYAGSERVGDPWLVTVPTSLVYLESHKYPLPMEFDPTKPLT